MDTKSEKSEKERLSGFIDVTLTDTQWCRERYCWNGCKDLLYKVALKPAEPLSRCSARRSLGCCGAAMSLGKGPCVIPD